MILGFTGTRDGMTDAQRETCTELVWSMSPDEAHHGDCIGADADFDQICKDLGIWRIAWPGHNRNGDSPNRAWCEANVVHDVKPYVVRDRIIVGKSDHLIACPNGTTEYLRSGTWMTVRFARKLERPITIVWPDGDTKEEV